MLSTYCTLGINHIPFLSLEKEMTCHENLSNMFFAFNRFDHATSEYGYTFMLVPEAVPLRFPKLTFSWLYDFGNIAAFIPFGVLIPLLYRSSFGKFITVFVLTILVLETLQTLTYLGSFEVDDVISNTVGAVMPMTENLRSFTIAGKRIPDNEVFKGEVTIMADGNMLVRYNEEYNKAAEPLDIPFDKINEITIIVSGNAKLWDVRFSEMKHWWE